MKAALVYFRETPEGLVREETIFSHEQVKQFEDAVNSVLESGAKEVYVVNRTRATAPPPGFSPTDIHSAWCPHCADERYFYDYPQLNQRRCYVCGISDDDYYVRFYNPKWDPIYAAATAEE